MKFYYLAFVGPLGPGCTVVKATPSDNGFNWADAHNYLLNMYKGMPQIIVYHEEINEHRYEEMKRWIAKVNEDMHGPLKAEKPAFTVHQGGKDVEGSSGASAPTSEPPTPGGEVTPGDGDQTRRREGGFKPTLVNLDNGGGVRADIRKEEVRGPQLEEGLPTQPDPGGLS